MCPVRYELGFYIPEDDILHSHRHENLKSSIAGIEFPSCCVHVHATVVVVGEGMFGLSRTDGAESSGRGKYKYIGLPIKNCDIQ
jgi:hypothetical protein